MNPMLQFSLARFPLFRSVSISLALVVVGCSSAMHEKLADESGSINKYMTKRGFKAYAIQVNSDGRRNNQVYGFAFNMSDQESANNRALEFCLEQPLGEDERCVVYAEGNSVVFDLNAE